MSLKMFSGKRTKYQYFNDFTSVVFNFQYDASYLSIFLILYEASHIEKFEGTEYENGNSFFKFQPKMPKYEIFFENSKDFSF